jgi:hydroxyacylglutathione hydrolase
MRFKQFIDHDLGCASYLIASEETGEAVVVDPAFAIEQYLEEAERWGARITRVVETHNHADHVSGHGRLALEHGVRVAIHPLAEPDYPFDSIEDGGELHVGDVTLLVLHTPGHRPEHCAILVADELLLTGDSLFVGDAARAERAVAV